MTTAFISCRKPNVYDTDEYTTQNWPRRLGLWELFFQKVRQTDSIPRDKMKMRYYIYIFWFSYIIVMNFKVFSTILFVIYVSFIIIY